MMNEMRWHAKEVNQEETGEDRADEMNQEVSSKDEVMRDGKNDLWFWDERVSGRARVTRWGASATGAL